MGASASDGGLQSPNQQDKDNLERANNACKFPVIYVIISLELVYIKTQFYSKQSKKILF